MKNGFLTGWKKVVVCKTPSFGYRLLRLILSVFSIFYYFAITLRNFLYDVSIFKKSKVGAAVVSVGNITVGGTGKTPLVVWLCIYFAQKNIKTAVLTRGYGLKKPDLVDEPAMLAKNCPNAEIIISPDRTSSARKAIIEYGAKLLIMDDGFQHRRLARDVDIIVIDATEPFGCGRLLPAGFLREPLGSLKRADAVVLTRVNQVLPEKIAQIKKTILKIKPEMVFATAVHRPICAKTVEDKQISLDELKGRKIYAFCGIGNPDAFFKTLSELALNIAGKRVYNDHYRYEQSDITEIADDAKMLNAEMIITTEKDWTKASQLNLEGAEIPMAYLAVELEFVDGQQNIIGLIEKQVCTTNF